MCRGELLPLRLAFAMDATTQSEVLKLALRACKLMNCAHYARAAEKLAAALALTERSMPPDCLVCAFLHAEKARSLYLHSRAKGVSEPEKFNLLGVILDDELPALMACVERRRAADTLMPGRCLPAEVEWFRQYVLNSDSPVSDKAALALRTNPNFG